MNDSHLVLVNVVRRTHALLPINLPLARPAARFPVSPPPPSATRCNLAQAATSTSKRLRFAERVHASEGLMEKARHTVHSDDSTAAVVPSRRQ